MDPNTGAEVHECCNIVLDLVGRLVEAGDAVTGCNRAIGVTDVDAPCCRDRIEHVLGNPDTPRMEAALVQQPSVTTVIPRQHALPVEVLAASGRIDLDEHVLAKPHGLLPEDVPVSVGWRLREMAPHAEPLLPDGSVSQASDRVSASAELALEKLHAGVDGRGCFDGLKHREVLSLRAKPQLSQNGTGGHQASASIEKSGF
ncbi:hypothetical protein NKI54_28095 [Mesorhizobium sp. M0663]|uniref:hypothetical protein n=1 Tax=Mesorhizobium sp. M0663 TaxID=2956981 RepID=UPI0033381552